MRHGWRLLLGALAAAALLFFFFRGLDWSELGRAFRTASPLPLAGVVAVTILVYAARAWRWGYLLAPIVQVGLGRLFSATIVGFMTGLLIPRAGEIVRPYLIARRHDVRTSSAFASIILERLVDLLTVLALFGLYLFVLPAPERQVRGTFLDVLKAGGAAAALGSCAILAVLFAFSVHADRAMAWTERSLGRFEGRVTRALLRMLQSFGEGLSVLQAPPKHLLAILGQSLLVWMLIAAGIYLNNLAFGIDLPFHSSFLIIAFLTVGVAVPTPGMVGGFHEAYLLAMTRAFGVERETAAAAGIASHALTNLPVLVLGLALLGHEGLSVGRVTALAEGADGAASRGEEDR